MTKNILLLCCSFFIIHFAKTQSIAINGKFTDWGNATVYTDAAADGNGIDLKGFSVTNDDENLYIRLITNATFNLADSNSLYLNIDADNNALTGYPTNGIGSELGWRFGSRYGFYYRSISSYDTVFASSIKLAALPTFKSDTFEIAISRASIVGSPATNLFSSNTIKLNFVNGITGGDAMPNSNITYAYTFTNTVHSDFGAIDLNKCNNNYIRLMEYNVLFDGLSDTSTRLNNFQRIFKAVNPDVIVLNECTFTPYQQVRTLLNVWLPLGGSSSWNCFKVDGGNIICSKYPILNAVNVSFRKATAAYIDLPSSYQTNLLVIGTHLYPGNNGDTIRQREADAIAAYIRDMKAGTTTYKIPANTPFVVAGDLNMVNYSSPLTTILNGNIVNTAIYGTAGFPDWNNAPLTSINASIADRNMTYTWRHQYAKARWWPGKLDYIIHSNTNLKVKKSFVLQTEVMSVGRLTQYNLQANDNLIASDHLPVVTDIEIPMTTIITPTVQWNGSINTAWENPANWNCSMVPDENSNVVIPSVAPNFPVINYSTEVRSIQSNSNSNITVQPGVNVTLNGQ